MTDTDPKSTKAAIQEWLIKAKGGKRQATEEQLQMAAVLAEAGIEADPASIYQLIDHSLPVEVLGSMPVTFNVTFEYGLKTKDGTEQTIPPVGS